jgi:hypothetical protein
VTIASSVCLHIVGTQSGIGAIVGTRVDSSYVFLGRCLFLIGSLEPKVVLRGGGGASGSTRTCSVATDRSQLLPELQKTQEGGSERQEQPSKERPTVAPARKGTWTLSKQPALHAKQKAERGWSV